MNSKEILQFITSRLSNYDKLSLTDKMIAIDTLIDNLNTLYDDIKDELFNNQDQVVHNPNSNVVPFRKND